jgi:WhiB family redox-sensing transcriptional regulator
MNAHRSLIVHDGTTTEFGDDWQERAACRGADTDEFYAEHVRSASAKHAQVRVAKEWCSICDVKQECLLLALNTGDKWGIFGGLTPEERGKIRRRVCDCGDVYYLTPQQARRTHCGKHECAKAARRRSSAKSEQKRRVPR